MKILVVSQYFWPEEFRINDICEGFIQQGHEVEVLTGIPNYPQGKETSESLNVAIATAVICAEFRRQAAWK